VLIAKIRNIYSDNIVKNAKIVYCDGTLIIKHVAIEVNTDKIQKRPTELIILLRHCIFTSRFGGVVWPQERLTVEDHY